MSIEAFLVHNDEEYLLLDMWGAGGSFLNYEWHAQVGTETRVGHARTMWGAQRRAKRAYHELAESVPRGQEVPTSED